MHIMKSNRNFDRRTFLQGLSACASVYCFEPYLSAAGTDQPRVRFGLITDVHQDIMHDAPLRVQAFVAAMQQEKPEFICQLGDFCVPKEKNRVMLAEWEKFNGPRYHVLGNHDTDGGFTQAQAMAFWGMPDRHYSFDNRGVHFVVLDGNEPGGKAGGYKRYVSKPQREWLQKDLQTTNLPTVILIHQGLDSLDSLGVENGEEVRQVLEQARTPAGRGKVVACLSGHNHDDHAVSINGIHYLRINSASYVWVGEKYRRNSYSGEIHEKFPTLSATAPYKDPLWAVVDLDLAAGRLILTGRTTAWAGPDPWERGMTEKERDPELVRPRISDRVAPFPA